VTLLAYRFTLDPAPAQERALRSRAGAARAAFNWGLARVKANLGQREAERSCGIAEDDLTPAVSWPVYSMRKARNQAKDDVAPWRGECSKEAYASGPDRLAAAPGNWQDPKKGKLKGPRTGFPRFKSKRGTVPPVRFTTGAIRLTGDRRHVTLPVPGTLRTHEPARKLARRIAAGTARVRSAIVRPEAGRWFASFTVEVQRAERTPARPGAAVGVDLGVKTLAVFSDGRPPAENPGHYDAACRKPGRLSLAASRRAGPDRRTGQRPSNRWRRADQARNRVRYRTASLRRDAIRKLTSSLAAEYGTVVAEDLNVAGMVKNRRLARAISDAGFGEIRRQLAYKTAWNGGRLEVAGRWFPSSKTCSACGAVKAKLPLRVRTYACESCGLVIDRDENAALYLAALVKRHVAGSGPETENGRGADRKTSSGMQAAVKRQPGTARAGQTGTVPAQAGTAKASAHAH